MRGDILSGRTARQTAAERLYAAWVMAPKEDKAKYRGELAAICIAACRGLAPPFSYKERRGTAALPDVNRSDNLRSEGRDPNPFWVHRFDGRAPWVYRWIDEELAKPLLTDLGRYIARRCRLALINVIDRYQRRRDGKPIRVRYKYRNTLPPPEVQDECIQREWEYRRRFARMLTEVGVWRILNEREREFLLEITLTLPAKLTNVAAAKRFGVTEGAVRKWRKRIGTKIQPCLNSNVCGGRRISEAELAEAGIPVRKVRRYGSLPLSE